MKIIFTAVALFTALSFTPAWALFETDKQLSEKARISMIDALKTAEGAVPGKPVEVNMGKDDGKVVYKIEIIDAAKKRATFTLMRSRGKFIPSSNSLALAAAIRWPLIVGSLHHVLPHVVAYWKPRRAPTRVCNSSEGRPTITRRRRE